METIRVKYLLNIVEHESFNEAVQDQAWKKSMMDEIAIIDKNQTLKLIDRPSGKPIEDVKWIFKTKLNLDGIVQKQKASLVAKGYTHKASSGF